MSFLDLVFPKKCVGCGRYGGYVCKDCEVGMWEEEQICPACGRNSRYGLRHKYCKGDLEGLTCLWAYAGVVQKIIRQVKYKYQYDFLNELLVVSCRLLVRNEFYYFSKFLDEKPVVMPVPLHLKRERERGFNQAEVIAKLFAARHSLACNSHMLLRIKETKPQVGRTREERLKAMGGAFEIASRNQRLASSVLLVDDVWTTGATMRECAKVLKEAGVKKLWGFVLAR